MLVLVVGGGGGGGASGKPANANVPPFLRVHLPITQTTVAGPCFAYAQTLQSLVPENVMNILSRPTVNCLINFAFIRSFIQ
jgi:hypothetical protein